MDDHGRVWVWGLGTVSSKPALVKNLPVSIKAVAAGAQLNGALDSLGEVWAWRTTPDVTYDRLGLVGLGVRYINSSSPWKNDFPQHFSTEPKHIEGLEHIQAIAAGDSFLAAVSMDGSVKTYGRNFLGQLGDGTSADHYHPVSIVGPSSVVAVSAGYASALALTSEGVVWSWGMNSRGQRDKHPVPLPINGLPPIQAIAACTGHSLVLSNIGTVWSWGSNTYGQLGLGTADLHQPVETPRVIPAFNHVKALSCSDHSAALKDDGTLWTWGFNDYGQLGTGHKDRRDGTFLNNWVHQPNPVPYPVSGTNGEGLLGDVISVVAESGENTLALKSDGTVWAWGDDRYGELGDGYVGPEGREKLTPVPVVFNESNYTEERLWEFLAVVFAGGLIVAGVFIPKWNKPREPEDSDLYGRVFAWDAVLTREHFKVGWEYSWRVCVLTEIFNLVMQTLIFFFYSRLIFWRVSSWILLIIVNATLGLGFQMWAADRVGRRSLEMNGFTPGNQFFGFRLTGLEMSIFLSNLEFFYLLSKMITGAGALLLMLPVGVLSLFIIGWFLVGEARKNRFSVGN